MPSEKALRAKYGYDRTGDESAPTVMLHEFAVFGILRFYFGLGTSKGVTEVAFLIYCKVMHLAFERMVSSLRKLMPTRHSSSTIDAAY
jgi:hypothetical protein